MIKHELNRSFEWRERQGPFRVLSSDQARQYNELGFFVCEDVFDAATIRELIAEIDPIEAELEALLRERFGGKAFIARAGEITFAPHIVTRSAKARAFTESDFFRDLSFDLLGPDVRLYWDQSVYKKPGTEAPFPWHQDNGYTYIEPQQYLTCWVALTDATEENGCPWVIPGAHRDGTFTHRSTDLGFSCLEGDPEDKLPAPVRAGGVVVFSSLTPHATGPNLTTRCRKSYIVQFAPDGAVMLARDGDAEIQVPCNAPDRQFPILVNGAPPEPEAARAE